MIKQGGLVNVYLLFLCFVIMFYELSTSVIVASEENRDKNYSAEERRNNFQDDDSASWARLQVSQRAIGSMPFKNFRVSIYEDIGNQLSSTLEHRKRYYYSPMIVLRHTSAKSSLNNVTHESEMVFTIEMWNDVLEKEVAVYASQLLRKTITVKQVEIIPFSKMMLTSTKLSKNYWPATEWKIYQHHRALDFKFICSDQRTCDDLASEMLFNPTQFSHLQMHTIIDYHSTEKRETFIHLATVTSGKLFTTLLQSLPDRNEAYLTAKDEKMLIKESLTNIIVEQVEDSEFLSTDSEVKINKVLEDMLILSRTNIRDENDRRWRSVFWDDTNYRPDKISRQFNRMLNKLSHERQQGLKNGLSKLNLNFKVALRDILAFAGDWSNSGDIEKLLEEAEKNLYWDGEKFRPKPLDLARLNLHLLNDTQTFSNRKLRLRYWTAVLSTNINFDLDETAIPSATLSKSVAEMGELRNELHYLRSQLDTYQTAMVAKMDFMERRTVKGNIIQRLLAGETVTAKLYNNFNEQLVAFVDPPRVVASRRKAAGARYFQEMWAIEGFWKKGRLNFRLGTVISGVMHYLSLILHERNDSYGRVGLATKANNEFREDIDWLVDAKKINLTGHLERIRFVHSLRNDLILCSAGDRWAYSNQNRHVYAMKEGATNTTAEWTIDVV